MKKIFPLLAVFLLMAAGAQTGPYTANDKEVFLLSRPPFNPGEKFTLQVFYNWTALWLRAGELSFTVREAQWQSRPVYHIIAAGRTYRSYEWFIRVRDRYETYMDTTNLKPLHFVRDVDEDGYLIKHIYDFDHELNRVYTQNLLHNPPRRDTFSIPDYINDAVSAIYYARCIDFDRYEPGDKIPLPVFIDKDIYPIYIRYLGKEVLHTRSGRFRCVKFRPLMLDNAYFNGGGEIMYIWATDDANRIPIRVESPLTIGTVKADLTSYSGLKYPLESRLP